MYASGSRTTPSLNKFYSRLVSLKTPDRILAEAKKLWQKWNISKEAALGREPTILGTTIRYSTVVPRFPCYYLISNLIYFFPSFLGNLALCVSITNLRAAEWRKINANFIISVSGLSLYDLCTFEEMEDKVFRHCPVTCIHWNTDFWKNIAQPGYLSRLLSVKLTICLAD